MNIRHYIDDDKSRRFFDRSAYTDPHRRQRDGRNNVGHVNRGAEKFPEANAAVEDNREEEPQRQDAGATDRPDPEQVPKRNFEQLDPGQVGKVLRPDENPLADRGCGVFDLKETHVDRSQDRIDKNDAKN